MMKSVRKCEPVLAVAEEVKLNAAPELGDPIVADHVEAVTLRHNRSMSSM